MTTHALAYHEAGHATLALIYGIPLSVVTITREGTSAGHARAVEIGAVEVDAAIKFLLAGGASESHYTGQPSTADANDVIKVRALLGAKRADAELSDWRTLARADVVANWGTIQRVATALVKHRTLTGWQVADLL